MATLIGSTVLLAAYDTRASNSPESVRAGAGPRAATSPTMSVSPSSGEVGSVATATGQGFPPDQPIGFTVGGTGVPSICSTDASGAFPGNTSTPCSFLVPAVPGGDEAVSARVAAGLSVANNSTGVGTEPWGAAYDSGTGQVFVANAGTCLGSDCAGTVSVLNATGASPVPDTNITVGNEPIGVAYDPVLGQVFVTNAGCNVGSFCANGSVSVIDDSNDTVVGTIVVGGGASAIAYDPDTGQMFVACLTYGAVFVINDSTDSVVGSVGLGGAPFGLAFDPSTQQVFVANAETGTVGVINATPTSDSLVATVTVGAEPEGVAYDPATHQIFVTNTADCFGGDCNGSVSVINATATSDNVVADPTVGEGPEGILYDYVTGQLLVSNTFECLGDGCNGTVSVLSANATSDNVTATLVVGDMSGAAEPQGLAFDSSTGQIYVADGASDNVSVIEGGNGVSVGTASLAVRAAIGVTASADVGQIVTISGDGFGNASEVTTSTIHELPVSCVAATRGTCSAGALTTTPMGVFSAQFVAPTVPTAGPYPVSIGDSVGNDATAEMILYPDPISGSLTVTNTSVDIGQSTAFTLSAPTSGTGEYNYSWQGLPAGCRINGTSAGCDPSLPGNYSVSVEETDSNAYTVTSNAVLLSVYSDPAVTRPGSSTRSGGVDAGQSETFTTGATGGTGSYTGYRWTGLPTGCTGSQATVTCSGSGLSQGEFNISVTVTDSNDFTSVASPVLTFLVEPDPSPQLPAANRTSADVGQWLSLSEGASGPGYRYAWSGLPSGCDSSATSAIACRLTAAGAYEISVQVTDPNNFSAKSPVLPYTVYADPSVELNASATAMDLGQSVTLTATVAGGSGGVGYAWLSIPRLGCQANGAVLVCRPTSAGEYVEHVTVTDSNGETANASSIPIVVAPAITAEVSSNVTTLLVGSSVTFSADGNGGSGPLTYTWQFGDGTTGAGPTVSHAYTAAATYTVSVWVNDTVGGSVEKTLAITVTAAPGVSNSSSGWNSVEIAGIAAAAALAAVVLGAATVIRRRRSKGPEPEPAADPDAGSSGAEDGGSEESGH